MRARDRWSNGARRLALAALTAGALVACDGSLLDVEDPDNVLAGESLTPADVPARTAGVVSDFANMLDFYALYAGLLTDEFILAGTFPTRLEVDERRPQSDNTSIDEDVWEPLSVSRATADALVQELTAALGDPEFAEVQTQVREGIAFGRLVGGYDRVLFAEFFCQSIFGGQDDLPQFADEEAETAPVGSDARMQEALALLAGAETAAADAGLESERLAAIVGQARAQLWLGNHQEAAQLASRVPSDFVYLVEYSDNTIAQENEVFQQTWNVNTGGLRWTVGDGSDTGRDLEAFAYFAEWVDQGLVIPPAIAQGPANKTAFNGTSPVSLQTLYAGRSGTLGANASVVLASGWEARMIEAENELRNGDPETAQGDVNALLSDPAQALNPMLAVTPELGDPPGTGDFVSEQLGAFQAVDFGDEPLQGDLVELARAREAGLWLTGDRQATLRRLAREFNDRSALGLYPDRPGSAISLPVPASEVDNNVNIDSPCPAGLP